MGYPVMHFEVLGKDGKKLQEFYSRLFDWKIDDNNPMNYGMVDTASGGQGIGGGVGPGEHPAVRFYVAVPDLQACLDEAEKLGGKTIMPPEEVPGGPKLAMFSDPEGNQIGLVTGM